MTWLATTRATSSGHVTLRRSASLSASLVAQKARRSRSAGSSKTSLAAVHSQAALKTARYTTTAAARSLPTAAKGWERTPTTATSHSQA